MRKMFHGNSDQKNKNKEKIKKKSDKNQERQTLIKNIAREEREALCKCQHLMSPG